MYGGKAVNHSEVSETDHGSESETQNINQDPRVVHGGGSRAHRIDLFICFSV